MNPQVAPVSFSFFSWPTILSNCRNISWPFGIMDLKKLIYCSFKNITSLWVFSDNLIGQKVPADGRRRMVFKHCSLNWVHFLLWLKHCLRDMPLTGPIVQLWGFEGCVIKHCTPWKLLRAPVFYAPCAHGVLQLLHVNVEKQSRALPVFFQQVFTAFICCWKMEKVYEQVWIKNIKYDKVLNYVLGGVRFYMR